MRPLLALLVFLFDLLLWAFVAVELFLGIFLPLGHLFFLLLSGVTAVIAILLILAVLLLAC